MMHRRFSLGFCCASLLFLTIAVLVVISPAPDREQAEFGPPTLPEQPRAAYPKATEVSFEPNRGQTDPRVRYISRGAGRPLFLKPDGLVARLRVPESDTDHVVEMKIIGANAQAESEELDPRPGRSNYFVGNDPDRWQRGVRRYARVKFREVYPGIDLLYRGSAEPVSDGGQLLEYDFIVKPGADPGRIRLQFNGVEDVRVDDEGDLTLRTPAGDLRQLRPVVYQEIAEARRPVEGRFDLSPSGEVGFALGPYDSEWPLVIDPKVEYSTYLGGSGDDQAFGIKVGPDGSIYVTGWTESVNFPDVTAKGIGGNRDAFVASVTRVSTDDLESRPALNYSSVLGGFSDDHGQSITVDRDGNAYITGFTSSGNSFSTTDGSGRGGGSDSFTAAFDPGGNLVFAGLTGGSGDDRGWSIDVNEFSGPEGMRINVITAGGTNSRNGISTDDAFQKEYGGGDSDGWISSLRLDATSGAPFAVDNQSTSYLGGNRFDIVDTISFGKLTLNIGFRFDENDPIVGMTTSSDNMPVSPLAPHPTRAGGTDGYVAALRLDQTGAAGWGQSPQDVVAFATYLPGGSRDESEVRVKIAENTSPIPQDRVYFSYNSFSNNVPTDENAAMSTNPGEQSFVLTRLERDSETGKPVFVGTTYGGGSQFDQAADLALDPNGAPAVVGLTFSQLPTTTNAIFPNRNGAFSGFVNVFSDDLTRIYSTFMWGNPNSNVTAIDFDAFGQIHIVGINGPGALITPNAFQQDFGGGNWDVTIANITRPFVFNNGIGNGASFRPGASPQQISIVVGDRIGPQPPVLLETDGDGNVLIESGGVRVLVDGEAAPLTFVSDFQDAFTFPLKADLRLLRGKGEAPPVVNVQVEFEGDLSNVVEVPVMEANPGLFAFDGSGQGQGAILNPDFSINSAANPAPGDSFIVVYGTGGGVTDPICPDGGFGPGVEPLPRLQLPFQVFVDGVEADVPYAGSAPGLVCGVNQFNVVPTNNPSGPAVPIQACVNDVCSNIVTAAFE